jgi:trans-aconitate methyltransferase
MIGREQALAPELGGFERAYIRLFGFPALGLRVRAKSILPLVSGLPSPRAVLDAGCGKGVLTLAASRLFPEASIVGADFSADLIERNAELARRVGYRNVRFLRTDLTCLEEHETYDLVLATDVLEHVDDDAGLLRRFLRALRPGGHLVLHVPHVTRHVWRWSRLNFLDIEGHVRAGYERTQLWRLLEDAGFLVESGSYNYNSIETLMNDVSHWITGGREQRRWAYAACFPILLLISWLAGGVSTAPGSGLVFVARRPRADVAGGSTDSRRAA